MTLDEQIRRTNRENRRKKRKKAQMQAIALFGGAVIAVALIFVLIVAGVRAIVRGSSRSETEAAEQSTQTQQPAEEVQQDAEGSVDAATPDDSQGSDAQDAAADTSSQAEPEEKELTEEEKEEQKQEMLDSYVKNILSTMTVEEKVGALFLVTPQNITGVAAAKQAGSATSTAIGTYAVGGILYDEKNMEDKDQFTLLIANTRNFSKVELFIAVSDEGGEDSPFSLSGLREEPLPGAAQIAASGSASDAYSEGINKSSLFRSLGVNLNLAPVTDVVTEPRSSVADRSYGNTAAGVLSLAKSEIKGMNDQGVNCCVKYFPGLGDVAGDTKTARVISQRTKEDMESNEYVIYKDLIEDGIPMIMVSHVAMPNVIGDNTPASLSSVIMTDILRDELGFEGVIITDYMNKAAITKFYKPVDVAVAAVQAGADMISVPADFKKTYQGLLSAVQKGDITEERIDESVTRILKMKYKDSVDYAFGLEDSSLTDLEGDTGLQSGAVTQSDTETTAEADTETGAEADTETGAEADAGTQEAAENGTEPAAQ